jgi:predicted metal-dependent hydrolase
MEYAREEGEIRHGEAVIRYTVVRSGRRQRTVQISVNGGAVVVRAPAGYPADSISDGVARRADWILRHSAPSPPAAAPPPLGDGATLPVRGRDLVLSVVAGDGAREVVEVSADRLRVALPRHCLASGDALRLALTRWFAVQAGRLVDEAVERWASALGPSPRAVYIRDQRSRWGSCSADGSLRINWRVAMLAPDLAEYVVVHELCHLRQRSHAPAFWDLVRSALPDVDGRRRRLRNVTLPL